MSVATDQDCTDFLTHCREHCNELMQQRLQALPELPSRLRDAMVHATLLGGKRIRPALAWAGARAVGGEPAQADEAACALEFIHCYSLIHDDLPAMDDDDLRRGRPTVHRAFDEATAILAGDALQSLAFRLLATPRPGQAEQRLEMVHVLATAAGFEGMTGGQSIDVEAADQEQPTLTELETMHRLKTGALIEASVQLGALSTGRAERHTLTALQRYGRCTGLTFQIRDDILDVVGDTGTLGKTQGADAVRNKPTYVALLGLDGARDKANALMEEALQALEPFGGEAEHLRQIARYIVQRPH